METVRITFPSGVEIFSDIAGVQSGAGYSIPRLISVSSVYRAVNAKKVFENSSIEITLNNIDGYFSAKMVGTDQYVKGKTVEYYDDNDLIFKGSISKLPRCPLGIFKVVADIKQSGLNAPINLVIKKTNFPNVPADNEGKYGNIIAGTIDDTGGGGVGQVTALLINANVYLAAWHHLHSLISVFNSAGTNITSSCTLDNNADGNAYINYTSSDIEIYFNCEGLEHSAAFTENPATILDEINTQFGDFTIDGIADAEAVYTDRGYTGISILIDSNILWAEFIQKFSNDWDAMVFIQANGNMKIKVLVWGEEVPSASIPEVYVHDFENWKEIDEIITEYKRMYWYHYRNSYFHRLPQDVNDISLWESESSELDLRYHAGDATSKDVAAGILFFKKEPAIYYHLKVERSIARTVELGDVVNIVYSRGYFPNQVRMFQVFKKEKLAGSETFELEGIDVTEINYGLIKLWDDTDADVYLLLDELTDPDCGVLL